ncbi:GreA/GreB family elongation factor [Candidatus Dojkabacteria bacterium]|nr:GreA/GreB family elongation factor [Candidatus Dojkabacteria bacterium]
MEKIEEKIENQIEKIKDEIVDITNKIETFRNDGDVDNVGVGQELLDRLEILNEKLNALKKNLLLYQNARESKDINVGHTIHLERNNGTNNTITIVLPEDANSLEGYISAESPLGKALIGKRAGEEIVFDTPAGAQTIIINKLFY